MPTIYLLPSCNTCQRILATLKPLANWELRDIKSQPLTEQEIDAFAKTAGSYEALFSRRAILFRQRGLHEKTLTEQDYKALLLDNYTFLKRPVMQVGEKLFVGNAKKAVEAAARAV